MNRDLRKYQRQTTIRLVLAGLFLLYFVGGGLVYLIYGPNAALSTILCITVGLVPIACIFLALWFLGWIVKRNNERP